MQTAECVVLGAGLAGAATAFHLARGGMRDIVIVDREAHPGFHSSGRNAAMIRQFVSDNVLLPLACEGAEFIRNTSLKWRHGDAFRPGGSIFTAEAAGWDSLVRSFESATNSAGTAEGDSATPNGLDGEVWSRLAVEECIPRAVGGRFSGGIYTPSDGTADVHCLLQGFLREAREHGSVLRLASPVRAIATDDSGRITGVKVGEIEISTPRVVNAAGAWAAELAALAGATDVGLTSQRRHLVYTGPLADINPEWPYLWDLTENVYFRPESSGLLLSPCDQSASPPGVPNSDPAAAELLGTKLRRAFPRLAEIPVARMWAGLRVFAKDGRFVLGPDPHIDGFYWAAALGGHGVTTCPAVGRIVAESVLDGRRVEPALSAARFSTPLQARACT